MSNSAIAQQPPTILLLSDSDALIRVIDVLLRPRWTLQAHQVDQSASPAPELKGDIRLIILALSQPTSQPVTVLHRMNLFGLVGQVPMIIISLTVDQSEYRPDDRIWYLNFPPDWNRLPRIVSQALAEDRPGPAGLAQEWPGSTEPSPRESDGSGPLWRQRTPGRGTAKPID